MSTGDHPLTACYVSRLLGIAPLPCAILDVNGSAGGDLEARLRWQVRLCSIATLNTWHLLAVVARVGPKGFGVFPAGCRRWQRAKNGGKV